MGYASSMIATGGAPSTAATVSAGSALGKRKYKLQDLRGDLSQAAGSFLGGPVDAVVGTIAGPNPDGSDRHPVASALSDYFQYGNGGKPAPAPTPVTPAASPAVDDYPDANTRMRSTAGPFAPTPGPYAGGILATRASGGQQAPNLAGLAGDTSAGAGKLVWNPNHRNIDGGVVPGWDSVDDPTIQSGPNSPTFNGQGPDFTAAGSAARAAAAPPASNPTDLGGLLGQRFSDALTNSPYVVGSAKWNARQNLAEQNVNRAFAGSDQALMAMAGAQGHLSSGNQVALAAAHNRAMGDTLNGMLAEADDRQNAYLGGILGLRGQAQSQGQADVMNPLYADQLRIGNSTASAMGPLNAALLNAQIGGLKQGQQQSAQLFPVQLQAGQLANEATIQQTNLQGQLGTQQVQEGQNALRLFADSYQDVLAKQRAGRQLSQAEAAQAQFVADNPVLMAVLGILPGVAQAGATYAGKAAVGV